jgi:hypothetical protein
MKCLICGSMITEKTLDISKIISKDEAMRLYTLRKEKQICSPCSTSYLMLDLGFKTLI